MFDVEYEIRNCPEFVKLMESELFCYKLWSAFANLDWYKEIDPSLPAPEQVFEKLTTDVEDRTWGRSFRGMGGVIAQLRNEFYNAGEDYMDYYCCGPYATVTQSVLEAMKKIGWVPCDHDNPKIITDQEYENHLNSHMNDLY